MQNQPTQDKLTVTIPLGNTQITVQRTFSSDQEFVEKLAFLSSLPTVGPNGEKDLKFVARTTKEGHKYYSIVCESAKKEFKFGQSQKQIGTMYGKGWEDLFLSDGQQSAPSGAGLGQVPVQNTPVQNTPVQNAPVQNTPPQNVGLGQTPVQNAPVQNAPVPTPEPAPVATTQAPPPSNNAQVNDVLAKYGIGQ